MDLIFASIFRSLYFNVGFPDKSRGDPGRWYPDLEMAEPSIEYRGEVRWRHLEGCPQTF